MEETPGLQLTQGESRAVQDSLLFYPTPTSQHLSHTTQSLYRPGIVHAPGLMHGLLGCGQLHL